MSSSRRGRKTAEWLGAGLWLLGCSSLLACESEKQPRWVTQVQSLSPAPAAAPGISASPAPAASPVAPQVTASPCVEAERQARELSASLPQQLDADTRATRVTARGCDLTMEYELSTLLAVEVAPGAVDAMQERVIGQLCMDRGALAVLQRGGVFTNAYYDRVHAPIGHFSVAIEDCEEAAAPATPSASGPL
jgi:hypothetical protein